MKLVALVPLLPLIGVLINGLFGAKIKDRAHLIAVSAAGLSCLVAFVVFFQTIGGTTLDWDVYPWLAVGDMKVPIGFLVDPLSTVMMLVVTFVGFLIHVYSIGYMHGDRGYARFFTYLNLFMFSMLMLVLANNYLLMFLGWEGVGLCSYLLIGFWYEKKSAADAGKKAFVVNRIGDAGFILGLFFIWTTFGSLKYTEVFAAVNPELGVGIYTTITLLLFVGATGKSAQLPLYVWLPDAMEGPTPVSALIHAATMVTAGVYLIARSAPLFQLAPLSLEVVAWVGGVTALYAASIALVQTDIKRIIAYSTISQLGYMFLGLGVGAYAAGIFHLMTHAFFKALLFLSAGSVIHALAGEQDIRKMGGLRRSLRVTSGSFLVGALANAGIAPFAGFWSKDEILSAVYASGHGLLWVIGALTAAGTGFYMFRLYFLAFEGKSRLGAHTLSHVHEAPWSMRLPLVLLALGSATVGSVGVPPGSGLLQHFLSSVFPASTHEGGSAPPLFEILLAIVALVMAVGGIAIAFRYCLSDHGRSEALAARYPTLYRTLFHKYWVDELYEKVVVHPIVTSARAASESFDARIVDGSVNGIATLTTLAGSLLRRLQTGHVPAYILSILVGAVALLGYLAFYG